MPFIRWSTQEKLYNVYEYTPQFARKASVCEKDPSPLLNISCSSGFLIYVNGAIYGRQKDDICPYPDPYPTPATSCAARSSLRVVSSR